MKFDLKAPCGNCPFRKTGAIELRPGRLEGIIKSLSDDHVTFPCHKTTEASGKGGDHVQACMGATAFMHRRGRLSILLRLAIRMRMVSVPDIESVYPHLLDDTRRQMRRIDARGRLKPVIYIKHDPWETARSHYFWRRVRCKDTMDFPYRREFSDEAEYCLDRYQIENADGSPKLLEYIQPQGRP